MTWTDPLVHTPKRYSRDFRERDSALGALDSQLKTLGATPVHKITTERTAPPADIAALLQTDQALVRRRLVLVNGSPYRMGESWFPLDIVKDSPLEEASPTLVGGVKSALAALGYPQTTAKERITASRTPTPAEFQALDISPERSVAEIMHIGYTADGRVVEVTVTVAPAQTLVAEFEFDLD
ncbi:UTRA domain-containing protein [Actinomadura sp. WMMB 499]|uniref:UTRA domain-containing protein n=1 Tax=Actinomadura sp. WMMB 499 TaxID=1219491 RepID=UPI0020C80066|nr:UTRA domain-containing protein [Actinomadura sp. WMMB 499]